MATVGEAWRDIQARLEASGIEPAPGEGKRLVAHVLGMDILELTLHEYMNLELNTLNILDGYVARRISGEPLAYILGKADFWGREWMVRPGVLVPRPDTEILVREALARLPLGAARVAEVGVGSGCVIGSLLMERPELEAYGTDISAEALAVTRENVPEGCDLRLADGLEGLPGGMDVVVSNPPYVSDGEYAALEAGVRDFEPKLALVGDSGNADGLRFYRYLAVAARDYVKAGGWLVVEIGWRQGQAVMATMRAEGWQEVACVPDLAGRDRVVAARRPA